MSTPGTRAGWLLALAWLGPVGGAGLLWGLGALAASWSPGQVPAFCANWPQLVDDVGKPLPAECEPGVPPLWVDVSASLTRFTGEAVFVAAALGLLALVAVVWLTRRTRAVDAHARLVFRLGVASLVLVLSGLVIAGLVLVVYASAITIRG